ncbi:uncharacterized protein N7484_005286 [Penicillium longicatenatum]|uniref:uncharacterized protein n=1 Tax=Penicillium longicatenatum TaxID=1561947 RepID=UPI002547F00A|nr:uncharacterized protein N7484_005286 [Penicillium longicatenatum]KAJ5651563.1 hypothetical protein N7484_005286 [Penicillium longicatenatum]
MRMKPYLLLETLVLRVVSGHLIMMSPEPYSNTTLNNSPLASNGSDFPCKLRDDAFAAPAKENIYEVGVSNTMRFMGSATHGGGSCQLSLTEDLAPSKESIWKVIRSYEGGCPKNVGGNLAGDANSDNDIQLDFTIPENIASGKYTLAWTWFNRIGDREMYMNCAPITVDSPSLPVFNQSIQNQAQDYPPMFIANINGCMTPQNLDIRFPQPGKNVELNGLARNLLPEGQQVCTGTPEFGDSAAMNPIVPDLEKGNLGKADSYSPSTSPVSIQPSPCSCRASRRNTSHQ